MCLLVAVTGLLMRAMNVDVLAPIGFTVLVGLAAKNAILIVEFGRTLVPSPLGSGPLPVTPRR